MNKIYWTIGIIFTLALLGGLYAFVKLNMPAATPSTQNVGTTSTGGITSNPSTVVVPGTSQPGTQTGSAFVVASQSSGSVEVQDFTKDPDTKTSPNIPGAYFLAGGLDPVETGATFSIMYVESDKSFTISLLQEPLGEVRRQAEASLLKKLNISEAAACNLLYTVLVPVRVNEYYAGKNLKFSFCPGAEALQ
jgi:hypothetical protein